MNEISSYRCKVSSRLSSSSRACKSSSGHGKTSSKVRGADGIVLELLLLRLSRASSSGKGQLIKFFSVNLPAHTDQTVTQCWRLGVALCHIKAWARKKSPKVCTQSQLMHSIAESAPDGKVHGACRVHTTLSLSPLNFLCPVLAASFWIMCKSSTQGKYTIIHLTECNNMKSQASTSSRHCLPGAWLHRRMFSSFSFRLSS